MPKNLPSFEVQALIKNVVDAVKTVVDSIKTTADSTKTKVDSTANKVDAMDVKLGSILDGRVVKSVQRGKTAITRPANTSSGVNTGNVVISSVNPLKCEVLLDFYLVGIGGTDVGLIHTLTNTSLSLETTLMTSSSSNATLNISWQVIEFY